MSTYNLITRTLTVTENNTASLYRRDVHHNDIECIVFDGVTNIKKAAYSKMRKLKCIKFVNTDFCTIGPQAFYGCDALEHIDFPSRLVIYDSTFSICGFKKLVIPSKCTVVCFGNAFCDNLKLKHLDVKGELEIHYAEFGTVFHNCKFSSIRGLRFIKPFRPLKFCNDEKLHLSKKQYEQMDSIYLQR